MKVTESHRKLANEISKMFTFQSGIHEPSGIYYEGYTLDKEAVAQLLADRPAPSDEADEVTPIIESFGGMGRENA